MNERPTMTWAEWSKVEGSFYPVRHAVSNGVNPPCLGWAVFVLQPSVFHLSLPQKSGFPWWTLPEQLCMLSLCVLREVLVASVFGLFTPWNSCNDKQSAFHWGSLSFCSRKWSRGRMQPILSAISYSEFVIIGVLNMLQLRRITPGYPVLDCQIRTVSHLPCRNVV